MLFSIPSLSRWPNRVIEDVFYWIWACERQISVENVPIILFFLWKTKIPLFLDFFNLFRLLLSLSAPCLAGGKYGSTFPWYSKPLFIFAETLSFWLTVFMETLTFNGSDSAWHIWAPHTKVPLMRPLLFLFLCFAPKTPLQFPPTPFK